MKNDKEKFKTEFKSRVYNWTLKLIKVIDAINKDESSKIMASQVLRSGTSIGANYIEAQCTSSKKDFTNFLHHSLKSANETKFWMALLRDAKKMEREIVDGLIMDLNEISNILGASLLTVKGKR